MLTAEEVTRLQAEAAEVRKEAIKMATRAGTGHLGTGSGMASILWVLYSRFMKYDPKNPEWPERDRFILSKGHSCLAPLCYHSRKRFLRRKPLLRPTATSSIRSWGTPGTRLRVSGGEYWLAGTRFPQHRIGMALARRLTN